MILTETVLEADLGRCPAKVSVCLRGCAEKVWMRGPGVATAGVQRALQSMVLQAMLDDKSGAKSASRY